MDFKDYHESALLEIKEFKVVFAKGENSVKNKFFTREFVPTAQSSQVMEREEELICVES